MRYITVRDVALEAGVSFKTVSRVVHNKNVVRAETRQRVLHAIEALEYRADAAARGFRGVTARSIALVYDNPNAYYIVALQYGALAACRRADFGLHIHPCDSQRRQLAMELQDVVHRLHLAGLVLAPPMSESWKLLLDLKHVGIPVARIISASEDPCDGSCCVYVNDHSAARSVAAYLVQLGHRRIGFLRGGPRHRSSRERYEGYVHALADYGIRPEADLVLAGDYAFDDGFRGTRHFLGLSNPPTAIFGSNDEIAAGVLAAAQAAELTVPHDLSIAGFEDSPFACHAWPALTTARQCIERVAARATEQLLAEIEGHPIGNQGFVPELVTRSSTAPPSPRTTTSGRPVPLS